MPGRRLLLIAAEFPPRGGGGVLRATKLVKYLSRLGWDITVVCSDEPPSETDDPALLAQVSAARIVRVRGPLRAVGAAAKRGIEARKNRRGGALIWDSARTFARAFAIPDRWIGWSRAAARLPAGRLGNPEVIVSSGPPHSAHLAARSLAKRLRVPFVVDLRDDWAGNPLFASPVPWRDPIDRRLERRTLEASAGVIVVSEASQGLYANRYPRLSERVHVIPNGFDPEDLPPRAPRQPSAGGRVSFVHAGSLRYSRAGAQPLFEAFGAAARENPALSLVLVGSVSPSNAERAQAAIPAANLSLLGFVPHAEALEQMASADVLIVISSVSESGAGTLTGKIFECLAVGRPILLLSPPGPATELVESAGAGVVADPGDPGAVRAAIGHAAELGRSSEFIGGRPDIVGPFNRQQQATKWARILQAAISDSNAAR